MTTSRLAFLTLVLALMSVSLFLPRHYAQPVGLNPVLPEYLNEWWGQDKDVSKREHDTLGEETDITRKQYENGLGSEVLCSIVLAGHDMMTGIHRPERCLPTQGRNILSTTPRVIDVPGWGKLPVTVLRTTMMVEGEENKKTQVDELFYYFFVGAEETTPTHIGRMVIDARDRLLKGFNQRWGMVLFTSPITKNRMRFGMDEQQTNEVIQGVIQKLAPQIIMKGVQPG